MQDDPRYPIGRFQRTERLSPEDRAAALAVLEAAPATFRAALDGLGDAELDTPYREGGWTVRQIAHHLPDSHLNAYVRMRLILTEDQPTVRPYDEKRWAELPDARSAPVDASLAMLEGVHSRMVRLLRSVDEPSYQRAFYAGSLPGFERGVTLDVAHDDGSAAFGKLYEAVQCEPVRGRG